MSPRELGFRLPFEGDPHAATWLAWPFRESEWPGLLEPARQEYAAFLEALARREPVWLLLGDGEAEADARSRLSAATLARCRLHPLPLDDIWFRDNGPLFVHDGKEVRLVHWDFNAWGQKYTFARDRQAPAEVARLLGVNRLCPGPILEGGAIEVNGQGLGLTTRQCLLHPGRNPGLAEAELEGFLRDYLGIDTLIWLDLGLEGDHTDGHIDTLARFVGPRRVVACVASPGDPNHAPLEANRRTLLEAGLEVVELPLPSIPRYHEGVRLPETYANFYLARDCALVPQYGQAEDPQALEILRSELPGREVLGLSARTLITGGGAFHCLTQPQPEGIPCVWP